MDYYIDLHGGDRFEALVPHVYHVSTENARTTELSLKMAMCVEAEFRIEVPDESAGTVAWAASKGVPGILIERGGMGMWSAEEVEKTKQDVFRIMKYLKIMKADNKIDHYAQAAFKKYDALEAPDGGLWYPVKKPGDAFREDDILGYIKDIYGEIQYIGKAKQRGILLYQKSECDER